MVKNKSKRPKRKRPTSAKYKFYKIEGDTLVKARECPRCGPGVFLAKTSDRVYCGKCHYTEFSGKSEHVEKNEKAEKTTENKESTENKEK